MMALKEFKEKSRALKRPGLVACYRILEALRFTAQSYSDLARVVLKNRSDLAAYLELLETLNWIKKTKMETPSKSVRGSALRKYVSKTVFQITPLGQAFLEGFPDNDSWTKIMQRPGLLACRKILEECSKNGDADDENPQGLTTFSYLCHRNPEYDSWAVVGNRNNCIKYLKLLCELGWLEKKAHFWDERSEFYYDISGEGELVLRAMRRLRN
jgi:hypothetical protein